MSTDSWKKKTQEQKEKQYALYKSPFIKTRVASRRACLSCEKQFPSVSISQRLCKECRARALKWE